jgi:transposase
MNDVKEVFRLKFELKKSNRTIAKSLGMGRTSVANYVTRFAFSGLSWPLSEDLSHSELMKRLMMRSEIVLPSYAKPHPDFKNVYLELKKKAVTLMLLWDEYRLAHPDGYGYTQFCCHYKKWQKHLSVVMRQEHVAGDKMFVDYSGMRVPVVNRETGEVQMAEVFVAVLGASNYTYAEASYSQNSSCWIMAHVRAFEYFGGVPQALVPDNLKSGVQKPCRYEPLINANYYDMASYYGTSVMPARVYKPKDKAKAEGGVCLVQRWILARLRQCVFFSLEELNAAIWELLIKLNNKPMQKIKKSRLELFEEIEKITLKPLPQRAYPFTELQVARVNLDYHFEVDKHYYSAPYTLEGEVLQIRLTPNVVEGFFDGKRVVSHRRRFQNYKHTTHTEHMPEGHQRHAKWGPERIVTWGHNIALSVGMMCEAIMATKKHPEQGCRSALGLIRLEKKHGKERLIKACGRAMSLRANSYTTVKMILENKTENVAASQEVMPFAKNELHENIRGADYYETQNRGESEYDSGRNVNKNVSNAIVDDGQFAQDTHKPA